MLNYGPGDIVIINHKNYDDSKCLVLNIRKFYNFYEVELLKNGKKFKIIDDGNFHSVETIARNNER